MQRKMTLHVFASAKGGVGKSTLAITCAKLLANVFGRSPYVIDADMTGTSLADGLHLCAPEVELRPDGTVDIEAPPTGKFLTRQETKRRRAIRRDTQAPRGLPPPFLNDALRPYLELKEENLSDICADALAWRHENGEDVWYLPSSALHWDMVESLAWFRRGAYDWMTTMTDVLERLSIRWPKITDVIVDVPPGLFGFGAQMIELARAIQLHQLPKGLPDWENGPVVWDANIYLVTTPDDNDLLPVYESVAMKAGMFRDAHVLVNKNDQALKPAVEVLGPTLGLLMDERRIHKIARLMPTLGSIFTTGDLRLDEDVMKLASLFAPKEGT